MSLSLSRSEVQLFPQCRRCFWLNVKATVKQPPGFPCNLNSAVDRLLDSEFDRYRGGSTVRGGPRPSRPSQALHP